MIDNPARLKLKKYFQNQPVVLVYLFGSQAEGKTTPLSDYDFAVLFENNLSPKECFERKLEYITELGKILGTDKIEILKLNTAPANFRYSAFAPRQEIYVRDEGKRIDFEQKTMAEYFDRLYYLRRHSLNSLKTIAKEGFGL